MAKRRQIWLEEKMLLGFVAYLCCGAVVGILAGLLGIGGGTVIVPMLCAVFPYQGIPQDCIQQMAVGTSLASIIFTSLSSARAHHTAGAVRWDIFKNMTPGLLAGTFLGGLWASHLPQTFLKIFFVVFLFLISFKMLTNFKTRPARSMPGFAGTASAGGIIGLISSFVGIGGGSVSVPFMVYCNVPMHTAVGTSAALGFPIALAGALGYVTGGWGTPGLPPSAPGFVDLWALLGISIASCITAPYGAKLSHKLPTATLKKGFACFLIIIAIKMLWGVL